MNRDFWTMSRFAPDNLCTPGRPFQISGIKPDGRHFHRFWEIKLIFWTTGELTFHFESPGYIHDYYSADYFQRFVVLAILPNRLTSIWGIGNHVKTEIYGQEVKNKLEEQCLGNSNKLLQELVNDADTVSVIRRQRAVALAMLFQKAFAIAIDNSPPEPMSYDMTKVASACRIIWDEYYKPDLTVASISSRLDLTPNHLARLFKKNGLPSPRQELIKVRLSQARLLLEKGSISVKDAADVTGWSNQLYFSNSFYKYYGIRPSLVSRN